VAFIAALLILSAGFWITPAEVESIPLCVFHFLTGWDCPGCGLTRSFLSMSRLHLVDAIRFNAAGPILYGALFVYAVNLWFRLLGSKRHIQFTFPFFPHLLVIILMGQWVVKSIHHFMIEF